LKDAPYFIGLTPNFEFKQRATSAYVLDIDKMEELGIRLLSERMSNKSSSEEVLPSDEFSKMEEENGTDY
jgi:hypothetical protein